MRDFIRLLFPFPRPLSASRRRRVWVRLGEPLAMGAVTVTVMRDVIDGKTTAPHLELRDGDASGRCELRGFWVPGREGVSCIPRAVRLHHDLDLSVLFEIRAEAEGVELEAVA